MSSVAGSIATAPTKLVAKKETMKKLRRSTGSESMPAQSGAMIPIARKYFFDQIDANHSTMAMARSAIRSRADNFSLALLSWPHAARISRPRGVRTGDA